MLHRKTSWVVVCAVALAACEAPPDATLATATQAIKGGDTRDSTLSQAMPERAIGYLTAVRPQDPNNPNGPQFDAKYCTAFAVAPDVVISAAHCFCDLIGMPDATQAQRDAIQQTIDRIEFHMPYLGADGQTYDVDGNPAAPPPLWAPGTTNGGIPVHPQGQCLGEYGCARIWLHAHPTRCDEPKENRPLIGAGQDLAAIVLARRMTPVELPQALPVYTGDDFYDRFKNALYTASPFPPSPVHITGWASKAGQPWIERAATLQNQSIFFRDVGAWFFFPVNGPHHSAIELGDSGSPITAMIDGRETAFGVSSSIFTHDDDEVQDAWSPTFNNRFGNGWFLRPFVDDADGDGVVDTRDNCHPGRWCRARPSDCANADQADGDGDGVGDACDNCGPGACTAFGLAANACPNADQRDRDGDGVGDVCDGCPETADVNQIDADGDRVTMCDTCPAAPNAPRACRADADCADGRTPAATCLLVDGAQAFGRCGDGAICAADAECGDGVCPDRGTYGRCSRPLDDPDADGRGAVCDACPGVADATTQADSNIHAERATLLERQGDRCDAVPIAVPHPRLTFYRGDVAPRQTSLPLATAFAVGRDQRFEADVIFDYCDCLGADGEPLDEVACRQRCVPEVGEADPARWRPITVRPDGAAGLAAPLRRTFSNAVTCGDGPLHRSSDPAMTPASDTCRVGELETLSWRFAADVAAGAVPSSGDDGAGPRTAGLIRSTVLVDAPRKRPRRLDPEQPFLAAGQYASDRDRATAGRLRVTYVYVSTPFQAAFPYEPAGLPYDRSRLVALWPEVGIGGGLFGPPGGVPWPEGPTFVVPTDDGDFGFLFGDGTLRSASGALSPGVRAHLAKPHLRAVLPVEGRARPGDLAFAFVPAEWRQSNLAPAAVRASGGQLRVQGESVDVLPIAERPVLIHEGPSPVEGASGDGEPLGAVSPDSRFVPADREGAVALLSATDDALFLVGGRVDGEPTGDVWRFSFADGTWSRAFDPAPAGLGEAMPTVPHDVRAATYDAAAGRFLVLDEAPAGGRDAAVRLLALDRAGGSRVLGRFHRHGAFDGYQLAPDGRGGYVLAMQHARARRWVAYRLRVDARGARFHGAAAGRGLLLPGLHADADGVAHLAVEDDGGPVFVPLHFGPVKGPPAEL